MSTLDDLLEPMSSAEIKASIYEVISITGTDTTAWKPGATLRTIIATCAIVLSALSVLVSLTAKAGWLRYARGYWLTLLAEHWFGVIRREATKGTCLVTVVNTAGSSSSYAPFEFTISNLDTGKTYWNTEAFSLGPHVTVPDLEFVAKESGADSTSTIGTITRAEVSLSGITCTNTTTCVCLDEQTDADLIVECKATLGARSPMGPRDAYEIAARNAKRADGLPVDITRIRTTKDGYGNVYAYLANAQGGLTGDKEDTSTDLGAANDAMQRFAAPLGVTCIARGAGNQTVDFTFTAWVRDDIGLTAAQAGAKLASSLATFATSPDTAPIGGVKLDEEPGRLFLDSARAAMSLAVPGSIWHVAFSSPASDPVLNSGDVVKIGTITPTIVFSNQNVVNS